MTRTLNDSGTPGFGTLWPLTIASYVFTRPDDVVGLDRQDLLQGISRAVRLERPDFHFAEALAAELRLAAERLLRDEGVRAGRTGVDLIVNQMVELEDSTDSRP